MQSQDHNREPSQKRLACDRCHTRKLRCLREIYSPQCSRCIQDGSVCTYSSPLKSGRPRKTPRAPTADAVVNHHNHGINRDNLYGQNININLDAGPQPTDREWQSLLNLDENLSTLSSSDRDGSLNNVNLQSPSSHRFHDCLDPGLELEAANDYHVYTNTTTTFTTADTAAAIQLSPEIDSLYNYNGAAPAASRAPTTTMPPISSFTSPNSPPRNVRNQVPSPLSPSFHCVSSGLHHCPNNSQSNLNSYGKGNNSNAEANINSSHDISEIVHRLSRLQQDLLQLAKPSCGGIDSSGAASSTITVTGNGSEKTDVQDQSQSQEGKRQSFCQSPVNAVLKPGQELVDIIRLLLSKCQHNDNECARLWPPLDHQTLLPLILTPMSLLLSIYGQLLREIAAALHQCRLDSNDRVSSSSGSTTGTHPIYSPLSATGLAPSTINHHYHQQLDNHPPRVHSNPNPRQFQPESRRSEPRLAPSTHPRRNGSQPSPRLSRTSTPPIPESPCTT
ncbi:hypothetical protein PHISCL_04764 [Aspergillus sclerotialis]|uniref:Zn(2)-C6 fungal-type domain-containing protein n=1 Tax=Aspergillus sclerotialis TaxID=2070753 RepID=A0A3A2ZIN1_9EURO|nr:hypothetical protein PHISCL_04764 [Aspergillus sclerotialis]